MILNIFINLFSAFIIVCTTILFLFFYYNHTYKKNNKENSQKIKFNLFLKSFLNKFLLDKIDVAIFDIQTENSEAKIIATSEVKKEITSVPVSQISNQDSIMYRSSKDYGADADFSVRTWFGVNHTKLAKENYQYICFNIKGVEKIYFTAESFLNLINSEITKSEQKKYIDRDSFDTYIMKSKENDNWYITRLGTNLTNPIRIE